MDTPLLDKINFPSDLRRLPESALQQVADELRAETIGFVSVTGGHLGSSLGVVELTVALHYVFDTPRDVLIWDVGHQTYPHKILTGRKDRMHMLRQKDGLSGFTKRSESVYDPFGAGHSSTSISAALGAAVGRDFNNKDNSVIAVIGDGAMSAGMAYEALNNAGAMRSRLIVILNDNDMSIAPPVGALRAHLSQIVSSQSYLSMRAVGKRVVGRLPALFETGAKRIEESVRSLTTVGNLFGSLGFYYIGPIDGYDLDTLLTVLRNVKQAGEASTDIKPMLVHVITSKGKGYPPAEGASDKYHGVKKFDLDTGKQLEDKAKVPSYSQVFAEALISEAKRDEKIVAVTAAMSAGTGLDKFEEIFPDRLFDVGIAEQHAVTFAAGMAIEGLKPFCAIYSTFLQRAYDQVIHDVAIQKLAVRFAIDRAGLVEADGPTHAGSFDLAYLGCIPNLVVMAPSNEVELRRMVATAVLLDDSPSAIRYPKGCGLGSPLVECEEPLEIGRGCVVKEGSRVAIFSIGSRLSAAMEAARCLDDLGISVTVADARFLKPLDSDLLRLLVREHEMLLTVEEGSIGGFGAHVLHSMAEAGLLDHSFKVRTCMLPDAFFGFGSASEMYASVGLDAVGIVNAVRKAMGAEF